MPSSFFNNSSSDWQRSKIWYLRPELSENLMPSLMRSRLRCLFWLFTSRDVVPRIQRLANGRRLRHCETNQAITHSSSLGLLGGRYCLLIGSYDVSVSTLKYKISNSHFLVLFACFHCSAFELEIVSDIFRMLLYATIPYVYMFFSPFMVILKCLTFLHILLLSPEALKYSATKLVPVKSVS